MTPVFLPRLPMTLPLASLSASGLLWLGSLGGLAAQEAASPAPAPKVEKIGENTYRLGQVVIDAAAKSVSLPVEVNMREGILEYVLVGMKGKVHESLLVTPASPMELSVALKLCRFREGVGDLLDPMLPPTERLGPQAKSQRGSQVSFTLEWLSPDGKKGTLPIHEWVTDIKDKKPSPEGVWYYTGSRVVDGHFIAESEGSFIALYLDPNALFNSALPGSDDDERWGTRTEQIPPIGTKGLLTIRLIP